VRTWLDQFMGQLPHRYGPLAHALSSPLSTSGGGSLGVSPARVLISQYPDFARGDNGQLCGGRIGPASTWQFIEQNAGMLNSAVRGAAHAHHWTLLPLDESLFTGPPQGHGYCASSSYFVGLFDAYHFDDLSGAFHPNYTGHAITAAGTVAALCKRL
jgi:hypothetical protein